MKIIFLDVDGVLNSEESIVRHYEAFVKENGEGVPHEDFTAIFPEEYMNNLKEIVEKSDAKIVVSSTWRLGYPDSRHWLKLISNLKEYGLDERVIGVTTNIHDLRCNQIKKWLEDNKELGIDNFLVLDDDSYDMGEFVGTKLAKTRWKTGLTEDVKNKALEILKGGLYG